MLLTIDLIFSLLTQKAYLMKLRQVLEPKFGTTFIIMRKITNMSCLLGRLALGMGDQAEAKSCLQKVVDITENELEVK